MYPVGSNGAAQAILDARCLADWMKKAENPMQALAEYENERLRKTAEIVRLNRSGIAAAPRTGVDCHERPRTGQTSSADCRATATPASLQARRCAQEVRMLE